MASDYISAGGLAEWQQTLSESQHCANAGWAEALARISEALRAYPDRIELREFVALLEAVGQKCRRSSLAWNVGHRLEWPLGTDVGRAVLGCRTLGTALHWICHYFPLIQDAASLKLDVDRDWTTLSYNILDPTIWPRHEDAMFTLGIYARLIKAAAPDAWSHVEVTVEAEQDYVKADLESIVHARVVYGGYTNSLRFPTNLVNAPLGIAPACEPDLLKRLTAELTRKKRNAPIIERTRHMIFREMNEGCVNQEYIARQLGISSRTLRRRLSEQGWWFQTLLDDCRMQFAAHEFRTRRQLSLSDVALRLGYSEHSTFSRAFSRWAGMAPQQYRRAMASHSREAPAALMVST